MAPSNIKKRKKERSRLPPDEIPQREIISSQEKAERDIKVGKREAGNKNFATNEGGLKKLWKKGMPTEEKIRREWRSPPREFEDESGHYHTIRAIRTAMS
ncbi:hypothetical protein CDAR_103741 [Caerostris darwini]|uniref:Uncharacterized protein n=1 Tax=Caerostris darwini TaxID=1538125 RepID=A0AAV4URP6_9ARAC|nr:hypothetical protein CDAR_103741 [Caerostris darwini]